MKYIAVFLLFLLIGSLSVKAELVLTPFGYIPSHCVHGIPHNEAEIDKVGDDYIVHLGDVNDPISIISRDQNDKSCINAITANIVAPIETDNISSMKHGWQVYTRQKYEAGFDLFNGQWNVPDVPKDNGQVLFLFTGLQNIDWVPPNPGPNGAFDIIQPVLQYGYAANGGGHFWAVASWYVTVTGDVAYSKYVKVSPADIIIGTMVRTDTTKWTINGYVQGKQATTSSTLKIDRPLLKSQPFAYVTLEVYETYTCSQYPTVPVQFTNMTMSHKGNPITIDWDKLAPFNSCGESIDVDTKTHDVTIHWSS